MINGLDRIFIVIVGDDSEEKVGSYQTITGTISIGACGISQ
ncbi:15309_t:CDS:2, partial [Entrophospora sp. SA101]